MRFPDTLRKLHCGATASRSDKASAAHVRHRAAVLSTRQTVQLCCSRSHLTDGFHCSVSHGCVASAPLELSARVEKMPLLQHGWTLVPQLGKHSKW